MFALPRGKLLWIVVGLMVGGLVAFTLPSMAQTSRKLMNLQGRLTDTDGNPTTGQHLFELRVFDDLTGGTQLYQEAQLVEVTKGIYNVLVGDGYAGFTGTSPANYQVSGGKTGGIPITVFNRDNIWLEIEIDEDNPLTPRTRVVSSAYSFNSDTLDGQDSSAFLGASAKAADADKLDGNDSAAFAKLSGATFTGAVSATDGNVTNLNTTSLSFTGGGSLNSTKANQLAELTQSTTATTLHKHPAVSSASVVHTSVGTHGLSNDGHDSTQYITDTGFTFVKERDNTDLMLTWFSSTRAYNADCYWDLNLNGVRATNSDGSYCRFRLGNGNSNDEHRPMVLMCHVDNKPAGTYLFQIYGTPSGDCYTGWYMYQRLLQVQEIERY